MNSSFKKFFYFFRKGKQKLIFFVSFLGFRGRHRDREQKDFDQRLVYSLSKSKIPNLKQIKYINRYLSKKERWLLGGSFLVIAVSLFFYGINFYKNNLVEVPSSGGEYSEALVGSPKYINPLYDSASDADSDLSSLIFSSLFKRDGSGKLKGDLATDYLISRDGKIYTINIRDDAYWHNGDKLTADDITFTFNSIKDRSYHSPLKAGFSGVEIKKINNYKIQFLLKEPYAGFLNLLTFGIIPQKLWLQIPPESASLAELNLAPIGSGPYKPKSLIKDTNGSIKKYILVANDKYYGQQPYIKKINFLFFVNFEEAINALNQGTVDGVGYLPNNFYKDIITKESFSFHNLNFPQIMAVFLNQDNKDLFGEKKVRQALALAINRLEIVDKILDGRGSVVYGPLLPSSFAYNPEEKKYQYNPDQAKKLLEESGWAKVEISAEDIKSAQEILKQIKEATSSLEKKQEEQLKEAEKKVFLGPGSWRKKGDKFLTIKLSVIDNEEDIQIVKAIKNFWEKIGIKTKIEIVSVPQIQPEIIRPRSFEALFYGQILGADPDVYAFWHSSQANEEGLNLSDYKNKDADILLEEARLMLNRNQRIEKYKKFQEILTEDCPAIFIYSPFYVYLQSKKINGFKVKSIFHPFDRFSNISDWYLKTEKKLVW